MSVYVDHEAIPYRGMLMCHMLADTLDELHAMAEKIGLQRRWFQDKQSAPHYDICQAKRKLAVAGGALQIGRRELAELMKRLRQERFDARTASYLQQYKKGHH